MKKLLSVLALAAVLSGCVSETPYGQCLGVQKQRDLNKVYKISVPNVILAVIFSQTIVVPLIVVLDRAVCPVGTK